MLNSSVFRVRWSRLTLFILSMALLIVLQAGPAMAKVFTVPPDITGDLNGTSGNDTITINKKGSVTGEVNGWDGSNTIVNRGTVGGDVTGNDAGQGRVSITNYGTVDGVIFGIGGGVGNVTIINYGSANSAVIGNTLSQGNVYILNNGRIAYDLIGMDGGQGSVTVRNNGWVGGDLVGNDSGDGNVTITNTGTVVGDLYGAPGGDGNVTIKNSGTVGLSILGGLLTFGDVVIINTSSGRVGFSIEGMNIGFGNVTIINRGWVGDFIGGINVGVGNATIINSGTVVYEIDGVFEATGNSYIKNTGTVGENIVGSYYSEGTVTIINSGTVGIDIFGNDSGEGKVYISNSGRVGGSIYGLFDSTDPPVGDVTIINTGTVGGSIIANQGGTGDSTIYNAGTVKGSIDAGNGDDTVTLAGGSKVSDLVVGGAGTDALYLQGSGVVQAPGAGISGFESVTMNGRSLAIYTGTWDFGTLTLGVVSGTHSIKGSMTAPLTAITGGSLLVNGNLYSPVTVTSGLIGGSGTIHGNVTNSGTVSPGNSIGTLTINGDYTQNAGSFYLCEVGASGRSDLLHVTGTANLQGGVLKGVLVRGLFASGTRWTVLTADGGLTGRFSGFKQITHSLTLSLAMTQSGDSVGLVVSRRAYAELADTPHELAVASTLDAILPSALAGDQGWAGFMTMLDFDYDLAQMRQAFKALSPEMYDAFSGAALNQARTFGLLMADRSRAARAATRLGQPDGAKGSGPVHASADELPAASGMAGPARGSGWSLWARTLGGWGYQDRSGEVNGYSLSTGGVVLGADGPMLPWLRLGVAMAAINTDFSWNGEHHEGDQQAIMAGLYATAGTGGLHLDGSLSYGSFDNSATRAIVMDGVSARARSSFDGTSILARLGGGYDFKAGNAVFGPTASLSYLRLEREGFSEHGADFLSLKVKEQTEDYTAGSLGFSAAWLWQRDDFSFMPRLAASWQHNFNADRREINASFVDYGSSPFTVRGIAPAEDLLFIEAGMTAQFTERFSAYLEYALSAGQGFHAHGFTAGVSWEF